MENEKLQLFEDQKIRTAWDEEKEEWYFSIVDVVSVLTESADGRKYWNKLKQRMIKEGNELVTNCHQLKLNAIEHTDAGGYVSISVTKSNSLIIIRVEDSGNGIAEQELDNLFRRFYRGSGNKASYGIGLSMAKDIVEAHHGIIQAGNNIDKGAWFEIRLLCLDGADIYKRT